MTPSSRLVLLLPERRRFAGQLLSPDVAKALGRADAMPLAEHGERAQLLRHFDILPRGWPMAAITRQVEIGDARGNAWLRADPVYIRAEMLGARLMAWETLDLTVDDVDTFLRALRPVFGDAGFPIDAATPGHWYVKLPADARLPSFPAPADALGGDVLAQLPEGNEARVWRMLSNEAQVILHNHPRNAARVSAGKTPVNSLWFWGGGRLPDSIRCKQAVVLGAEDELLAMAKLAGAALKPAETGDVLLDLRRLRDWSLVEREHLLPAMAGLGRRHAILQLDFADGAGFEVSKAQRWRWLRRPLAGLEA